MGLFAELLFEKIICAIFHTNYYVFCGYFPRLWGLDISDAVFVLVGHVSARDIATHVQKCLEWYRLQGKCVWFGRGKKLKSIQNWYLVGTLVSGCCATS